ncbi:hypothetical protein Sgleb_14340 [Streptomyces glebosus]|uniref:Pentapeptide repeat-containing protein n=1 Tax=Streptomyces glebosus TaxID=249580 RepID=A0A640SPZ7_9ACTN|nr:pentapeptide repeat-containing protein [Streptomyces glebosus]GFE13387.1 hypothetical protein Sgleb_14340 [Streptomyces glebosus]GHG66165.1 hypothetical protein GCM10010513_34980 [Streptomyces glebosus]
MPLILIVVYAMARPADDWGEQRQVCVDVLCAYLRMPYEWQPESDQYRKGEREVRQTIIQVIRDHLRESREESSWSTCALDFTRATFDGGDFSGCRFRGSVSFADADFVGDLISFDGAGFLDGAVTFRGARFGAGAVTFNDAQFQGATVSFDEARFSGSAVTFRCGLLGPGDITFHHASLSGGTLTLDEARSLAARSASTTRSSATPRSPSTGRDSTRARSPSAAHGSPEAR